MPTKVPTAFISNISYRITRKDLYELFIQVTPIRDVKYDSKIAHIKYNSIKDMEMSIEKLNKVALYGRPLSVEAVETKTIIYAVFSRSTPLGIVLNAFKKYGSCKCKATGEGSYKIIYRRERDATMAKQELQNTRIYGRMLTVSRNLDKTD
ncbi:hypothetical protein ENBRE01_0155 [Enteropsectra breve]|nr:hypothetical protein ENBRE01_0155 [Enteropsectra breve]